MVQSPIQSKKQGNKKRRDGGRRGRGVLGCVCFLISFSIKWRWHKTVYEETLNTSLLFCLFIRLHQRLISEGSEGNLKKYMPVAVPSLSYNILEHPLHSLSLLVFFAEAEERGCVSFSLSLCFSIIQFSREKSSMKYPFSSEATEAPGLQLY